jgi:hypothetical protein
MRYDININGAAFCTGINSAQFSHLNPSITPGNHQWKGAAPLFNRRGVQMIIGVYEFLSNVNRSSVNVLNQLVGVGIWYDIFTIQKQSGCGLWMILLWL